MSSWLAVITVWRYWKINHKNAILNFYTSLEKTAQSLSLFCFVLSRWNVNKFWNILCCLKRRTSFNQSIWPQLSNWLRSRQWLTNRVLLCPNPGKNYRKIAILDKASWAHAPTSFLIQTNKTSILIFKITFPFTVKCMTEYHRCFRLHWISNHSWEPLSCVW